MVAIATIWLLGDWVIRLFGMLRFPNTPKNQPNNLNLWLILQN